VFCTAAALIKIALADNCLAEFAISQAGTHSQKACTADCACQLVQKGKC